MKKIVFLFLTASAAYFSHAQGGATLTGTIEGWGNDTLAVYRLSGEVPLGIGLPGREGMREILVASGGRFEYAMPDADTAFIAVLPLNRVLRGGPTGDHLSADRVEVLLAPGRNVAVEGRLTADGIRYTRSGGALEELWNRYDLENSFRHRQFDRLLHSFLKTMIELKSSRMPVNRDVEQLDTLLVSLRKLGSEIEAADEKFIHENTSNTAEDRSLVALKFIPRLSSATIRNGLLGMLGTFPPMITQMLDEQRKASEEFIRTVAPEGKVPDFTLRDIDDEPFALSSLEKEGKYIVLDFWGSWCVPCIVGMPEMKTYYEKYRGKLEIVGIACRDHPEKWKSAVADLALPWIHVFDDPASPQGNVAARYGIKAYPTKIILGPDRTVVGFYRGEGPGFYEKLDELLK